MVSIERVIELFKEISAIPRGSGNGKAIADYCEAFASEHQLVCRRDAAHNVVIYKAANGCGVTAPLILQGHLDMVCQQTAESTVDFLRDGITVLQDGDVLTADGTTLGADNGIAVAMVLAVLEDTTLVHPPIEAVLTADEEIGMVGAMALDMTWLHGKRMINLDAEEDGAVTVSCAGGSEVAATLSFARETVSGTTVEITLDGLKGGHSGVEIHHGRINAAVLSGRVLEQLQTPYAIASVESGDKSNAIPYRARLVLVTPQPTAFVKEAKTVLEGIREEIADREPLFDYLVMSKETATAYVWDKAAKSSVITALVCAPDGVQTMSASIDGLVETSLNLGVLQTREDKVVMQYALRSNKRSALCFLEERLVLLLSAIAFQVERAGHYPPWEYRADSPLRERYAAICERVSGQRPRVEAIHAGLECGVFAAAIEGLDCIAVGPALYDVHTVNERLSISSTARLIACLTQLLRELGCEENS